MKGRNSKKTSLKNRRKLKRATGKALAKLKQLSHLPAAIESHCQGERYLRSVESQMEAERWNKNYKRAGPYLVYLPTTTKSATETFVRDQVPGDQESVKILIVLVSGEQRLITFDVPDDHITVQDLLCQLDPAYFSNNVTIQFVKDHKMGINYIVDCTVQSSDERNSKGNGQKLQNAITSGPSGINSNGNKAASSQATNPLPLVTLISRNIDLKDYESLQRHENNLSQAVVDFCLKHLLTAVLSNDDQTRTHVFSSNFYKCLHYNSQVTGNEANGLYYSAKKLAQLRQFTANVNIFEKDFVVVPIRDDDFHWLVAFICFPGIVERESLTNVSKNQTTAEVTKKPCILIFDPVQGNNCGRSSVVALLRDYLAYEHLIEMGLEKDFSVQNMPVFYPEVPKTRSVSLSGLYVLQYVESFYKDPIKDYTLPLKTLRNWFQVAVVEQKRKDIAYLILKAAKEETNSSALSTH